MKDHPGLVLPEGSRLLSVCLEVLCGGVFTKCLHYSAGEEAEVLGGKGTSARWQSETAELPENPDGSIC